MRWEGGSSGAEVGREGGGGRRVMVGVMRWIY